MRYFNLVKLGLFLCFGGLGVALSSEKSLVALFDALSFGAFAFFDSVHVVDVFLSRSAFEYFFLNEL